MEHTLSSELRQSIAGAVSRACGAALSASAVRVPARRALASLRLPEGALLRREAQGAFCGAPLIKQTRLVNGWLLFEFSDALFDTLAAEAVRRLPPAADPLASHAINRLLTLARHGGMGCPRVFSLQRALFLCAFAGESPAALRRAEQAVEAMFCSVPPRERPAILAGCGAFGDACARLLSACGASCADDPYNRNNSL